MVVEALVDLADPRLADPGRPAGEALLDQAKDEKLVGGGTITVLPEGVDVGEQVVRQAFYPSRVLVARK